MSRRRSSIWSRWRTAEPRWLGRVVRPGRVRFADAASGTGGSTLFDVMDRRRDRGHSLRGGGGTVGFMLRPPIAGYSVATGFQASLSVKPRAPSIASLTWRRTDETTRGVRVNRRAHTGRPDEPEGDRMLEGCDHCGTVVREQDGSAPVNCHECGGPLRDISPFQARALLRERRIAEQFRRSARLAGTVGARRDLGSR
jgi:hypothetical protein